MRRFSTLLFVGAMALAGCQGGDQNPNPTAIHQTIPTPEKDPNAPAKANAIDAYNYCEGLSTQAVTRRLATVFELQTAISSGTIKVSGIEWALNGDEQGRAFMTLFDGATGTWQEATHEQIVNEEYPFRCTSIPNENQQGGDLQARNISTGQEA